MAAGPNIRFFFFADREGNPNSKTDPKYDVFTGKIQVLNNRF